MYDFPLQIVIIDDDRKMADSPLLLKLHSLYQKENVVWIEDPDEGINYIKAHLKKRTVVILDYNFPFGENGFEVFKKLQNESSLLYIVLNTSHSLKSINEEELKGFINNHLMAYVDKTVDGYQKTVEEVAKGFEHLSRGVDCALEEWILNLDEEERTEKNIITRGSGIAWSLEDLLHEIRQRTPKGLNAEKNIIILSLDLINRGKRPLNV